MIAPALAAYLLGAIPFSFLIGKLVYGIDIRTVGSGNVGATNLGRACGVKAGLAGLFFDAAKGFAAVWTAGRLAGAPDRATLLLFGCCAVIGHMAPIFLAGRGGGKGVATGAGVFLAIDPASLGIAFAVFAAVVLLTRYVSLGSVLAACALPIVLLARDGNARDPVFLLAVAVAAGIIYKHRQNLSRIRAGTESKLPLWGKPGPTPPEPEGGS